MELSKDELKEMMSIFKVESEEHLKNLNKCLLKLEESPKSKELLEELFRTAHSIKGSARMMGFGKIESVSHKIEDIFGLLRNAKIALTAEEFDLIYEGVDVISQIIEKMSEDGSDESIDVQSICTRLEKMAEAKSGVKSTGKGKQKAEPKTDGETEESMDEDSVMDAILDQEEDAPKFKPSVEVTTAEIVEKPDATVKSQPAEEAFIRVPTKRLDDLMNQVSELITTRIKSQQRLADIRKVLDFCEEWNQNLSRTKAVVDKISARVANDGHQSLKGVATSIDLKQMIGAFEASFDRVNRIVEYISELYDKHSEENLRTAVITGDIQDSLRVIRLLPISTIFDLYPRMVRDIAKLQNKKVRFEIFGADTRVDKKVLEELKDPLIHLLRNCIDHGVESSVEREQLGKNPDGLITIKASYVGNMVQIDITDDGRGIDTDRIAQIAIKKGYVKQDQLADISKSDLISLIFHSGFSTAKIITDLSGRGVGMDVVKSNIEKIKGTIETDTERGRGTKFTIKIPLTLSTTHVLIVDVSGDTYSLPIDYIERTVRLTEEELWKGGNNAFVMIEGQAVSLYKLEDILGNVRQRLRNKGLVKSKPVSQKLAHHITNIETNKFPAVVFNAVGRRVAFLVDQLIDEQEVVVKSLGRQLRRVRNVAGTTVLGDGRISIILDPNDLVKTVQGSSSKFAFKERRKQQMAKKKVLVVDDSITTRTLEKNILESAGYNVVTATNGQEGYQKLHEGGFDIVVSDVEMPLMTGFEFAAKVRAESKFPEIPFILCTSLESERDKRKGIEAGANAYIVKGSFDQSNLLETIEKLL